QWLFEILYLRIEINLIKSMSNSNSNSYLYKQKLFKLLFKLKHLLLLNYSNDEIDNNMEHIFQLLDTFGYSVIEYIECTSSSSNNNHELDIHDIKYLIDIFNLLIECEIYCCFNDNNLLIIEKLRLKSLSLWKLSLEKLKLTKYLNNNINLFKYISNDEKMIIVNYLYKIDEDKGSLIMKQLLELLKNI
ncbi:unnamed protein product, partial [Didymodactylos carnosus]